MAAPLGMRNRPRQGRAQTSWALDQAFAPPGLVSAPSCLQGSLAAPWPREACCY